MSWKALLLSSLLSSSLLLLLFIILILIIITKALPCGICCRLVLLAAELVIVAVHYHAVSVQLIAHQPAD